MCCESVLVMFGIIRHNIDNDDCVGVIVVGDGFECSGEGVCGVHVDFK